MACQRYPQGLQSRSSDSNYYHPDIQIKKSVAITIMELCTNFKIFKKQGSLDYFATETFHQRVIWFKDCIFDFF